MEHSAITTGAPLVSGAVQIAIASLNDPGVRVSAVGVTEGNQSVDSPISRQLENRPKAIPAPGLTGTVQFAIDALSQAGVWECAIGTSSKLIQRRDRTCGTHLKDRAKSIRSAFESGAVEIAVRSKR